MPHTATCTTRPLSGPSCTVSSQVTPRPAYLSLAPGCPPASRWIARLALAGLLVTGLGGCASVMRVDSEVQSHAKWPVTAELAGISSYQFERLPSQSAEPPGSRQALLEQAVSTALARVGWQAANPPAWRVAVSATVHTLPRAPWDEPVWHPGWGVGLGAWGGSSHRGGVQFNGMLRLEPPWHERSVSVVVRDHASGQIVYETQARHDGRWNDSPALWAAMIDAALQGFPTPPAGMRTVTTDLPR